MIYVDNGYHNRYCRLRTLLGDKRNAAHVPLPL
jgi:hypothetical protein